MADIHTIGIISDTHGVLPNEVFDIFCDVDQIIHAGDIGNYDILLELKIVAPVRAVYGNMDGPPVRVNTVERLDFHLCGFNFIVTHLPGTIEADSAPTIRINGHTHKPIVLKKNRSLLLNPGSAAKPSGLAKRSVIKLTITAPGEAEADIIYF
jgi:putative phosphoesterase